MTTPDEYSTKPEEIVFSGTKYEVVDRLHNLFLEVENPSTTFDVDEDTSGVLCIRDDRSTSSASIASTTIADDDLNALPRERHSSSQSSVSAPKGTDPGSQSLWNICLTARFSKSASRLDKKLQGRILAALLELGDAPDTPIGDTIKPLDGDRRGEWRYRIGDYRLIYRPDRNRREVLLLDVAPRGGVYA